MTLKGVTGFNDASDYAAWCDKRWRRRNLHGVEHHVGDEDGEQEGGEVSALAQLVDAVAGETPVGSVEHLKQGQVP